MLDSPSSMEKNVDLLKMKSNEGRRLVDAELVASVAWLIHLRWIAGAGVILSTWMVGAIFDLQAPELPLYAIGVGILFYNFIFYLAERRLKKTSASSIAYGQLARWQVAMDWLGMAFLIHYSGGIESPILLFFIFHIVIASIFFPSRTAYAFAVLAVILLSGIALLEFFTIIPHEPITGLLVTPLYINKLFLVAELFFFAATGLIVAYLASSISDRLRHREEEVVDLSESLQHATARLQALNDDARLVGSTLELPQVLNRIVESTAKALGVRACSIRLIDKTGRRLEPVAVFGLSQAYLDKGPVDLESNLLARQVLAGKTVNIPDAHTSPLLQYPEEARQEGIRSLLSAPLSGKSGPLGILRAYSVESDGFTKDDEAFLTAIAAQGGIAIDNALAYQSIEELDAAKSQFVRMVTHELRSPVSVISSLLRTLTAGYAGKISEQQLDIINRASRRVHFLQKLVDDLLDLAAGKTDVRPKEKFEPVDLVSTIQMVVNRYEMPAKEKGVSIEWRNDCASNTTPVTATPEGLDRIFTNLISNAVKYTPSGGHIKVKLSNCDNEVYVVVEDNGIGIPEEALGHLFEEFFRAPNAKAVEREGTGLGLTIVKDFVTRFGGRVNVQSALDQGTRLTVILPLAVKSTKVAT